MYRHALLLTLCISAFVMSMFFVPAFTAMIGHTAWWPGHGDEPPAQVEPPMADPLSKPESVRT